MSNNTQTQIADNAVANLNKPEVKPISIMIGTPMYGGQCLGVYTHACIRLQELCTKYGIPIEFTFLFNESLIQRGRNEIAAKFLASKHTHLFFIDADIGFAPEDVLRLVALAASENLPILGGTYPRKGINWGDIKKACAVNPDIKHNVLEYFAADYIFKTVDDVQSFDPNEMVEVEHLATGFLCIAREVFEKMRTTHPEIEHIEYNTSNGDRTRWAFFDCGINDKKEYLSEDFWFCKKARDLGYRIFMVPNVSLTHVGTYAFKGSLPIKAAYMAHDAEQAQRRAGK
jgi:hypothetical protein